MQAIKNGIKCTLRTPGKALLFALILIVLSVLLSVAFCVFSAVRGYLRDADGYFHTLAELEFVGENYPTADKFEPGLPDALAENGEALSSLLSHDAVLSFTPASNCAALVEGLHRSDDSIALPNAAVASFYITSIEDDGTYKAILSKAFYSAKNYEGKLISVHLSEGAGELEVGKKYLMSGLYMKNGYYGTYAFMQGSFSFTSNGETLTTPAYEQIETNEQPKDNVFMRLAEQWSLVNDACRVTYTEALEDELPFHQQQMKLKNGRFFTEEEYASNAKVVILSDWITYGAEQKKVGDRIRLSVYSYEGDVASAAFSPMDEDEYEIVGIFSEVSSYPQQIYIPAAAGSLGTAGEVRSVTGSSLGIFRLKNDRASAFLMEAEKLGEIGFRVSVYDQGYAAATEPMRELMLISAIFLAVCVILAAVALVLQSHIFVSRQRETAQTMYSVGASRSHIIAYFLSAALLLAAVSAVIGGFIAKRLEGRVFETLQHFAAQFAESDTRFSVARLSLVRTLDFSPKSEAKTYIAAALAFIFGTAASTLAFTFAALNEKRRAERGGAKKAVKSADKVGFKGKTSRLSGRIKYALLSMRRSPVRTLAVILLAASAAVFFSRLTSSLAGYQAQLENYKRGATIKGHATDLYGRKLDGFLFDPTPMYNLASSGEVKDMNMTIDLGYLSVIGVAITKDGVENRELPFIEPANTMEREMLEISVRRDLRWVGTSGVALSPAFHYKNAEDIRFLEGCSELDFMQIGNVCALSEKLMEQHGIELGDAVMFYATTRSFRRGVDWDSGRIILKVIAAYSSTSTSKTVFCPFSKAYSIDPPFLYGEPQENPDFPFDNYYEAMPEQSSAGSDGTADERILWRLDTYANTPESEELTLDDGTKVTRYYDRVKSSSFSFTLKDASRLDEARQALEDAGYIYVGNYERTKPYAIIDDEMYLNTTRSMQRQIQYVSVLYTALYILAGVIGFALAWLLTVSRRKEIALMRALGTPNLRIILNFFFEHAALCLAGLALGIGAAVLIFGAQETLCYMLACAFFILWCLATLLCLLFGLTKKTQAALTEAE